MMDTEMMSRLISENTMLRREYARERRRNIYTSFALLICSFALFVTVAVNLFGAR